MRRLLLCCVLWALPALAELPGADVEHAWLDPAGRGSVLVGDGQTLGALQFRAGAALFYTYHHFNTPSGALLENRLGFQIFGALGVNDWLQLGFNVPVIAFQEGRDVASAGLANPWLHAKVQLLDNDAAVASAVDLGIGVPVGTAAALGNGGLEVAPRLQLGKVYTTFQWGAEMGFLYRPSIDYTPVTQGPHDKVGSQVWLTAMGATVNSRGPRGEFSLRLNVPLAGGWVGVEGLVGLRWPMGDVELFGAVGPGFFGETTPAIRSYLGLAFANVPLTRPPCIEGQEYALADCPALDRDGDGVANGLDRAPLDAEDKDGFHDDDGVPDPDNDGDKVLDAADRCPTQAGTAANQGCPDVDTDGDGLVDRLDTCPNEPEDLDGYGDQDGCPEPDNDSDGVLDAADACPLEKGIVQERGCPAKDSDQDGVFDYEDNCPAVKGDASNAGCPAAQKQLVVITKESLKILDKVYFVTGAATIQARSNGLLDNVAQVLGAHPEIALVQIEGHTDNQGLAETNTKLSQARADAVKAYLVKKGIAEARLKAMGFGAERPAQPNDTAAGRDANRRVEFNLVPAP